MDNGKDGRSGLPSSTVTMTGKVQLVSVPQSPPVIVAGSPSTSRGIRAPGRSDQALRLRLLPTLRSIEHMSGGRADFPGPETELQGQLGPPYVVPTRLLEVFDIHQDRVAPGLVQ